MADSLTLEVPEALDGARVDKALSSLLGVSRLVARQLLDRGVLLEGLPARPRDRVRTGSTIETPHPIAEVGLQPEDVAFEVLYEDNALLVIDKPAGVVVHPGSGTKEGTLAAGLLNRYPELEGVGEPGRWGLIHRLDKDTSGTLIVARTQAAHRSLSADLAARRIGRTYLTLVHGLFPVPTGTIDAPIGRDPSRPTRRAVIPTGKPAITHYEVIAEYPDDEVTLLEVRLDTGRTHQIRVHLAAIAHPVIGDRTYSPFNTRVKVPRVFLHARRVRLAHPDSGATIEVESPLPPDLTRVLESLGPGDEPVSD
ncbi:MAG TPA: RluA family pseudouridine synthase [Acidimicrobiia bacterium]|nr:RluA family pseudouridine synthase [Acidimicrobiia bacterium]